MIRQIICRGCAPPDATRLDAEDRARGYQARQAFLSTKTPKGHGLTIDGVFHPLTDIHCDLCNAPITGEIAVAVTTWNANREGEPREWEPEYGKVLTDQEVKLADALTRKGGKP